MFLQGFRTLVFLHRLELVAKTQHDQLFTPHLKRLNPVSHGKSDNGIVISTIRVNQTSKS